MSVVWSGVTESGAVVPVQVDSLGRVIATTGESPRPPIIEYNGASAWGDVDENGVVLNGMNIASITKTATGSYTVVFVTPMPSDSYAAQLTVGKTGTAVGGNVSAKRADGFDYVTFLYVGGAAPADASFIIQSSNALAPTGGTGADAWVAAQSDASIKASFNVDRIDNYDTGKFRVYFTTPMPTDDYAVVATIDRNTSAADGSHTNVSNTTTTYFDVYTVRLNYTNGTTTYSNKAFNAVVHATSATLPLTVTREQLFAVINNWQKTADTLSTKDAVEMDGPVRFAGGKAGVTSTGEFYFTPGPGPEKYLLGIDQGVTQLKRIDSVY